jgi:hypothetical protein
MLGEDLNVEQAEAAGLCVKQEGILLVVQTKDGGRATRWQAYRICRARRAARRGNWIDDRLAARKRGGMSWRDVIESVRGRIHDERAADRELNAKWREMRQEDARYVVVHCHACCYDSLFVGDDAQERICLHCGADDPEVVEVSRTAP